MTRGQKEAAASQAWAAGPAGGAGRRQDTPDLATAVAPLGQTPCSLLRQQAGSQGSCPPLLSNLKIPPRQVSLPQALHVPTADKAQPRSCRRPGLSGQLEGRHFRLLPRQEVAPAGPAHAAGLFGFLSACTSSLPFPSPSRQPPCLFSRHRNRHNTEPSA